MLCYVVQIAARKSVISCEGTEIGGQHEHLDSSLFAAHLQKDNVKQTTNKHFKMTTNLNGVSFSAYLLLRFCQPPLVTVSHRYDVGSLLFLCQKM